MLASSILECAEASFYNPTLDIILLTPSERFILQKIVSGVPLPSRLIDIFCKCLNNFTQYKIKYYCFTKPAKGFLCFEQCLKLIIFFLQCYGSEVRVPCSEKRVEEDTTNQTGEQGGGLWVIKPSVSPC